MHKTTYGKFDFEVVEDAQKATAEHAKVTNRLFMELKILTRCMMRVRAALREQGDYTNADALREGVENAGFYIEDNRIDGQPEPPFIYRKYKIDEPATKKAPD